MVIYENINQDYFATQVTDTFYHRAIITLTDIWSSFRKQVVQLSNDEVLVTGTRKDILLPGVYTRKEIAHILRAYDIKDSNG